MTDQPRARVGRRGALSESEEEEVEEIVGADIGAAGEGAPVEKAVIQLTKLVSQLSKQKAKPKGIEGIFERFDGAGGDAGTSAASGGSRSKAAAYKKLKQSLQDKPGVALSIGRRSARRGFCCDASGTWPIGCPFHLQRLA